MYLVWVLEHIRALYVLLSVDNDFVSKSVMKEGLKDQFLFCWIIWFHLYKYVAKWVLFNTLHSWVCVFQMCSVSHSFHWLGEKSIIIPGSEREGLKYVFDIYTHHSIHKLSWFGQEKCTVCVVMVQCRALLKIQGWGVTPADGNCPVCCLFSFPQGETQWQHWQSDLDSLQRLTLSAAAIKLKLAEIISLPSCMCVCVCMCNSSSQSSSGILALDVWQAHL